MNILQLCALLMLILGAVFAVKAASEGQISMEPLTPDSPVDYNLGTHVMTATNGAIVRYRDTEDREATLVADGISYDEKTGLTTADGQVSLQHEGQLWRGEHLEYNFLTKLIRGTDFRTGMAPFFASGVGLSFDQTNKIYTATNAVLTTDDYAKPGFKVRAKYLKIVPGKSLEAHNATVYLDNVPVMFFPVYRRTFGRHPNNFVFTPGYRSLYGPYLLSRYNWYWNQYLNGGVDVDYRFRRGLAGGPVFQYDLGPTAGHGNFAYYYADDKRPGTDPNGKPIGDDRHRLSFDYQAAWRTNLTAKMVLRDQSDPYIIRDFFESEYRKNIQPKSFAEVNQVWSNWSLNALAQPRVNEFFETVERLPDVKLTGLRQQLGVSPFYYESDSSVGYFRYRSADNLGTNYAAARADSYHQIILPKTFFGWLNVTPRVGGRVTYYGETEGRYSTLTEQTRGVFNTGAEVSTKLSRTWSGAQSHFWEVDGLRHIFEPSVNYVYVPSPNVLPPQLPQFDTELPSFRLLPIEYPDYNSIDSIDSQNVFRLGLRNKLQTKRKAIVENLVDWDLYSDWRLKPRTGQSTFADIYSDLDLKPRSWLTLTSETRYSVDTGHWREANHVITFQPGDLWSWSLGHRYLRTEPDLERIYGANYGNNLITSRFYYKFNENWGFRLAHQFEARNGKLQQQYYTIYRDLRSWTTALTFRVTQNDTGPADYTIAISFSLKAFPRFGLGQDAQSPSTLLGG